MLSMLWLKSGDWEENSWLSERWLRYAFHGGGNPVLFPMISNMAELSCVKLSGFAKYMVDNVLAKGFFENLEKYKFEQLYMTNVDVNAPSWYKTMPPNDTVKLQ